MLYGGGQNNKSAKKKFCTEPSSELFKFKLSSIYYLRFQEKKQLKKTTVLHLKTKVKKEMIYRKSLPFSQIFATTLHFHGYKSFVVKPYGILL